MPSPKSPRTYYLIDSPTPFAPVEEWRAFVVDLETLEQTPEVVSEIERAKRHIAEVEAGKWYVPKC